MNPDCPHCAHNVPYVRNPSTEIAPAGTVEEDMDKVVALFLGHLEDRNRAPLTIARYGELLRRFSAFARTELRQGHLRPEDIDKALLVAFVREAAPGARLAPSTRNARLACMRTFFRWLVAEEKLARDPAAGVAYAKLPESSATFLTTEEFDQLSASIEQHATEHYLRRDLAIIFTLWHTGLRLRELASIDLAQVDSPTERFLRVRRKGNRLRDVHFNTEVTIALRRWLWERKTYPNAETSPALFLSDRGRRISPRAVQDLVAKYLRHAAIGKHATVHSLRHSTATELVRRGNGIEVVADVLDHRNLNVTRRYVHLVGAQVHAAVATLAVPVGARRARKAA